MKRIHHTLRSCSRLAAALLLSYGAVLTARADYPSTVVSQGPVTYWRLNEKAPTQPSVTTAVNLGSLGSGENATYNGGQGFFRGFPGALASSDTAVAFDGGSQAVQAPYNAALNPTQFTIEGWLAPAGAGNTTCALSCGDFASPRAGWLIYQTTASQWNLRMYNQNALNTSISLNANTNMVLGTYYHVVVTFDGTTARMYVNGVLLASGAPTGYVPGTAGGFSIGTRADGAFYWNGQADEVAFYNTVLTPAKIAAHYSAATTNAAGYAAQIGADSPLVYYRLNEAGDPLVANLGSLGSAGAGDVVYPALLNSPGPQAPTFPGLESTNTAADFSSGGYMQARPLNLNTNGFTITGWFKPAGGQAGSAGLVFHRAKTTSGGTYSTTAGLTIDQGGGLQLSYNWDGASYGAFLSGVNLTDGAWNLASLTVFPDHAVLFVPGQTPATNYATHAALAFEGITYLGLDPHTNLNLTTRKFVGAMDEVAIFKRALSLGEIYTQYGAAMSNLPPVVFWDPEPPVNPLYAGDSLRLVVDAGGTPNLAYQWRKNSGAIGGATSSSYTIASVGTGDTATYDVVVTNMFGTVTSQGAYVPVSAQIKPSIVQDVPFTSRTIYPKGAIKLGVVATGGGLSYQWQRYGTNLPGRTASSLVISGVTTNEAGPYQVLISNGAGSTPSVTANISIAVPIPASYGAYIANDGPVSWYRMDDAVNSPLMLDAMGRWDGYYTNMNAPAKLGVAGALTGDANTAAHFDLASKSWGEIPTLPPPISKGDMTVECWVRSTNSAADLSPVSSFRNQYGWFWTKNTTPAWRSGEGYGDLDTGVNSRVGPATALVPNQWTYLVLVQSSGTGTKTYINGVWDGGGPYVDFYRNLNTPMRIGVAGPNVGELNYWFDGEIDEVAVYTNALTDAQILAHYQAAQFTPGTKPFFIQLPASQSVLSNSAATYSLVGAAQGSYPVTYQWYKNGAAISGATSTTITLAAAYTNAALYQLTASNTAGTTNALASFSVLPSGPAFVNVTNNLVLHLNFDGNYQDSSGHGNNATEVGSPSIVPGMLGSGALFFSTSNSIATNFLTLGKPADLNFGTSQNFSVAYWVQYAAMQTNGDLPFLCSAIGSYGNPGFAFAPSYKQGGWSYSLNGAVAIYGPPNTINNGNWHHLVHTFDRTGFAVTYLDGAQVDSRLATGIGNLDTGNTINVGQDPTGGYTEDGSATIDDLAVWRRMLTAYEAYSIYYAATNSSQSFNVPGSVTLNASRSGTNIVITWKPGATLGTLLQADEATGPWTPVGVYVPTYSVAPTAAKKFYRVQF